MLDFINNMENVGRLFIGTFFGIIFIQSSLDKVFNWKGNLDWLGEHFAKTIIGKMMIPTLMILTLAEIAAGTVSGFGALYFLISGESTIIYYGLLLSCVALLMLILGQRLAQDYEGAQTIAIYFGVAMVGLFFF